MSSNRKIMGNYTYILKNKVPKSCSFKEWEAFFENFNNRFVKYSLLKNDKEVGVSTVFLGLDSGLGGNKPLVFETIVFGDDYEFCERYSTWEESVKGHNKTVDYYLKLGFSIIEEKQKYTEEKDMISRFELMDI